MVPMMGNKVAMSPAVFNDDHVAIAYGMGMTAEKVAARYNIGREAQDQFAVESHQRALAAIGNGEFSDEILPYEVARAVPDMVQGVVSIQRREVSTDEGPRADSTIESLAALRPVFAARGSVTAGNSSQMSDGAAAVLLASERGLKMLETSPATRFLGYAVAGVAPEVMGIGPIEAIPKALTLIGIKQHALDWIELNEAFAAQSLAVIGELDLDRAKVNPLGGAIALGHPLGATGAIRTATLIHGLKRRGLKYGMVTMCVGTGMGAAGVFEAVM